MQRLFTQIERAERIGRRRPTPGDMSAAEYPAVLLPLDLDAQ